MSCLRHLILSRSEFDFGSIYFKKIRKKLKPTFYIGQVGIFVWETQTKIPQKQ